jgi:CHAT domain-containing protein
MTKLLCRALVLVAAICLAPRVEAQATADRAAALDHLAHGTTAFRAGDMIEAARQWSEAIRLAHQANAPDVEAQGLARRGEMYRTQGYLRNAADDLQAALTEAESVGDARLIGATSGALGNLELAARNTASAEPLLLRSRDMARRSGDGAMLAASENDLGNLYIQMARPAEAGAAYAAAISDAAAAGDHVLIATAETNAARLSLIQGDAVTALARLGRAVERLERLPPSYAQGMGLVAVGLAVVERKGNLTSEQRQLAERAFGGAKVTAGALHNSAMASLADGSLGKLYAQTGNPGAAAKLTDQAVFAAQQGAPDQAYRWDWQQAQLARQSGNVNSALGDYRRAVASLEEVRQDIPVEYRDGRSSYRMTFGPLYLEFADLLLRQAAADPAQAQPHLREARDTIERLKETELQDYFRDSCVASFPARKQAIDTVAPGTAVLYPISLPDRLEVLVSIGQELKQFTIPVQEAALRSEVHQFRQLLEKRTTNEYLVPARRLYDQIVRPALPLLASRSVDTIVVVPDDVLRVVPFAALYDGQQFLMQRYATAVAPSIHLVAPKPLAAGPELALVLGISQSVQGYSELPNVSNEIADVHQLAGGETFANSAFTQARFASELKSQPYNIVHLASHGQFSSDPKQTFLLAYDGKLNMDALEADIKYGEHRDNPLELLVLSACETAAGDDRAALGLAGVALKAGARSALASLWYVNDEAAGAVVVDFYRALQSGESKAHALQQAQRQLVADPRFAHPAYWAPYLLIGNWL